MGLLDDPNLILGLGLLQAGSAKPVRTGLGEGLLSALSLQQQYQQAQEERKLRMEDQAMRRQSMQMQLDQQRRAQEQERERRSYLGSVDPNQGPALPVSTPQALAAGLSLPEIGALNPQAKGPEYKVVNGSLVEVGPGGVREAFRAPDKADKPPADWQLYELSGAKARGISFDQWDQARRRAGATSVTTNVNAVKPLVQGVAEGLAQQVTGDLAGAKAAGSTIDNAQRLRALVDGGKIVTGPLADQRVVVRQVAETLGVGGKTNEEVLANTRQAIQSMAQFELDAAQSMKGQGQITEAEREILRRAAAGNINMTAPELRSLSQTLEARARKRISVHQSNVQQLSKVPGTEPIIPMLSVQMPPESAAPASGVRRYNPQTGRIE